MDLTLLAVVVMLALFLVVEAAQSSVAAPVLLRVKSKHPF